MLNRILDALAARIGITLSIGVLLVTCASAALYFRAGAKVLEEDRKHFDERQLRNGFVSMSDIQRLTLIVQEARLRGTMNPEDETAFRSAADILFVRAGNFRRIKDAGVEFPGSMEAIAGIERIVEIADRAVADGFSDLPALSDALLAEAKATRKHLVTFLDQMRVVQDRILASQSRAVYKQTVVLSGVLSALTLAGATALMLLRREVLGRRAREQAERRVEFLAFYDALTELPNRAQFQDRLTDMLTRGTPLALLFIDLDDFKVINDTYGHAAGDETLCHVGRSIDKLAQETGGFAARLGGDEFAAVIPSDRKPSLEMLCSRILAEIRKPFELDGEILPVGVSIGLATTTQLAEQMDVTLDAICRVTDFALYASKEGGRNRFSVYDNSLANRYFERRAMLDELPRAIANGGLEVYFQPKVLLPTAEVQGFEALVRWRRGDRLVPPAEFIDLAEDSGLVMDIDWAILKQSTTILADWNRAHGTDYTVSVNLSALHFNSSRIIRRVRDCLDAAGLPPDRLTLEITETVELRDWTQVHSIIAGLKELGCRISVDDFGTGFSSLAYLRAIMADELKIDKSLVNEIETSDEARFIFDAVIDLAANLKMSVVVEGIETEEQAHAVHRLGARHAQGYFFGQPLPGAQALVAATDSRPSTDLSATG